MAKLGSKEPDQWSRELEASRNKIPIFTPESQDDQPPQSLSIGGEAEVKGDAPLYRRHKWTFMCCGVTLFLFLTFVLIMLILIFTYFKAQQPDIQINNVELKNFNFSNSVIRSIKLTLGLDISVYNPNHASFKYRNSTSLMFYRGTQVGDAPIPAGRIGARGTERLMTTVSINADQVLADPNLFRDFQSGAFPVSTSTQVTGRVNFFNVFKHHAHSTTYCNMSVLIASRSIENMTCIYHVGL